MSLELDLSGSAAKLARARKHFEAILHDRWQAYQGTIYKIRQTNVDKEGWCSLFLTPTNLAENDLSVTVGDLIHNLRCALDYIITALVDASKATITTKHQFPIFATEVGYRSRVGDERIAKNTGPLANIKYGLDLIWGLQPFQRKPNPLDDPLFFLHELSNSDKHRALALSVPNVFGSDIRIESDGVIVEEREMFPGLDWKPNEEREVRRVRFARPYPSKIEFKGEMAVTVQFIAAVGQHRISDVIGPETLNAMCEHVAEVLDRFKRL